MKMGALKDAKPFDRAFIDEMIPHHQGAIRMARAELAKGSDPELWAKSPAGMQARMTSPRMGLIPGKAAVTKALGMGSSGAAQGTS